MTNSIFEKLITALTEQDLATSVILQFDWADLVGPLHFAYIVPEDNNLSQERIYLS